MLYLLAAVVAVVVSHRLGLGSVTGYLLAGIAIGPWGLRLVAQDEDVRHFAELGVVFLLFVIGLELEPKRLWNMRVRLLSRPRSSPGWPSPCRRRRSPSRH